MYPLTIGLAIENRELLEGVQACLSGLPFRVIVEHQDTGDMASFHRAPGADASGRGPGRYQQLERAARGPGHQHQGRHRRSDDHRVEHHRGCGHGSRVAAGGHQRVSVSAVAGAAAQGARKALGGTQPPARRRAEGGGKAFGFLSAKGGCGATTLVCHVAQELGRQNQKVLLADLDLDAGMVAFITKTKSVYSILDAVNNLHRLDISYWKALVSNGIPGVEIVSSPLALASKQQPKDDQIRHVLAFARPHYDWTVVDLGRSLSRIAMAALEEIDETCLVTTLEVPALHQCQADHPDPDGQRLWQEPHQADSEPLAEAAGNHSRRTGEDARRADLLHDSERLSGAVRDLRGRPNAQPDLESRQSRSPSWR